MVDPLSAFLITRSLFSDNLPKSSIWCVLRFGENSLQGLEFGGLHFESMYVVFQSGMEAKGGRA